MRIIYLPQSIETGDNQQSQNYILNENDQSTIIQDFANEIQSNEMLKEIHDWVSLGWPWRAST